MCCFEEGAALRAKRYRRKPLKTWNLTVRQGDLEGRPGGFCSRRGGLELRRGDFYTRRGRFSVRRRDLQRHPGRLGG